MSILAVEPEAEPLVDYAVGSDDTARANYLANVPFGD